MVASSALNLAGTGMAWSSKIKKLGGKDDVFPADVSVAVLFVMKCTRYDPPIPILVMPNIVARAWLIAVFWRGLRDLN